MPRPTIVLSLSCSCNPDYINRGPFQLPPINNAIKLVEEHFNKFPAAFEVFWKATRKCFLRRYRRRSSKHKFVFVIEIFRIECKLVGVRTPSLLIPVYHYFSGNKPAILLANMHSAIFFRLCDFSSYKFSTSKLFCQNQTWYYICTFAISNFIRTYLIRTYMYTIRIFLIDLMNHRYMTASSLRWTFR